MTSGDNEFSTIAGIQVSVSPGPTELFQLRVTSGHTKLFSVTSGHPKQLNVTFGQTKPVQFSVTSGQTKTLTPPTS